MNLNDSLDKIIANKDFDAIMPFIENNKLKARDMKALLELAKQCPDPVLKRQVKNCFNKNAFRKQNASTHRETLK